MKVTGPGSTQGASNAKKSGKTEKGDSHFGDFMTSGTSSAEGVKTTQSIGTVDSLLALQGADDPTAQSSRKRMKQRAGTILDELEKIRIGMLTGSVTIGHMVDIADVIASHREKISDPGLTVIMDEIDLRAQVELAKMRMALDGQ
jgi:hypothetical protein